MKLVLSWLEELAPALAAPALAAPGLAGGGLAAPALAGGGGADAVAVESLAATMTALGLQVEHVLTFGTTVDGVITARVLRTERHPEAAKVHRVFVDAGDGVERHVWCGAFNMVAGDVLPLATPGTLMPDGRTIEPRPILGINSEGPILTRCCRAPTGTSTPTTRPPIPVC